MAITLVGTPTTGSAIDGNDITLSLPSGLAQDDVVYVGYTMCDGGTGGTSSSGWTQLGANLTNGAQYAGQVFRKVMGASPDANIVLTGTGNTANSSTAIAIAFRGVDTTTPEDGVSRTTATSTSTNPDPASITPNTSGAAAVIFAGTRIADTTGTGAPAGYSDFTQVSSSDSRSTTSYLAWKSGLTGGVAENPGAFTGVSSATWGAFSVVVKPAATSSDAFWFAPLSEPRRSKPALRTGANQFEAFVKAAPFPEAVSIDRWLQPLAQPYPYKKRLRTGAEPYQALQPTPIIDVSWHNALSEPRRYKPALRTAAQLAFAMPPQPAIEAAMAWFAALSEPKRFKKALIPGLQLAFTFNPFPITHITWFSGLSEPKRFKKALQTGQHPYEAFHPRPIIDISWWRPLDEPRRYKPKLVEASQMFVASNIEPVVSFSWIYGLSEPVRIKPRLIEAAKEKSSHMIFVNVPGSTGPLYIRAKFGKRASYWKGRSDG